MGASVTVPLDQAITRARQITFRPFDLGKWFVLGFAAWLAMLGEGGASFRYSSGGGGGGGGGPAGDPAPAGRADPLQPIWLWITTHLAVVIAVGALAAIILISLALLMTWVRSRATFIFLENLARNEAAIVAPWKQSKPLGNSLFLFWIALGAISLACYAALGGLGVIVAWPDIRVAQFGGHAIAAILLEIAALLPLMLVFALIAWCMNNFVAPLMYLRRQTVLPAWREFRTVLLPGNVGPFVLFLLLQLALRMAIVIISVLVGCATCCIGFLPYLGTVVTLPLHVFDRCYSVYFLGQFGPAYRIFREIDEPAGGSPFGPLPPPSTS
jgi:hypothetical protein